MEIEYPEMEYTEQVNEIIQILLDQTNKDVFKWENNGSNSFSIELGRYEDKIRVVLDNFGKDFKDYSLTIYLNITDDSDPDDIKAEVMFWISTDFIGDYKKALHDLFTEIVIRSFRTTINDDDEVQRFDIKGLERIGRVLYPYCS